MTGTYRSNRPYVGKSRERAKAPEMEQLCGFCVGSDYYALDIMRIQEIINPLPIRPVPKCPPFVEGVIELRGATVPVIDMRKRFDLPPLTAEELADPMVRRARKYLIVPIGPGGPAGPGTPSSAPTASAVSARRPKARPCVGLIIDRVLEVLRVRVEDLDDLPPYSRTAQSQYFRKVFHYLDKEREEQEDTSGAETSEATQTESDGRRRAWERGPQKTRKRILMVLDFDAFLSSTELTSLANLQLSQAAKGASL